MNLDWSDIGNLDAEEIDSRINRVQDEIACHAKLLFNKMGIKYLDWTNYLKEGEASVSIRSFAYYQILFQTLRDCFTVSDSGVSVLIPLTPHLSWQHLFEKILILDATAETCDYLYQDFLILRPGTWNFEDIDISLKHFTSFGDISKTKISKYKEIFLKELEDFVIPTMKEDKFRDPYVVSYKKLNGELFSQDLETILGFPVANYGATRGSNQFRNKDFSLAYWCLPPSSKIRYFGLSNIWTYLLFT